MEQVKLVQKDEWMDANDFRHGRGRSGVLTTWIGKKLTASMHHQKNESNKGTKLVFYLSSELMDEMGAKSGDFASCRWKPFTLGEIYITEPEKGWKIGNEDVEKTAKRMRFAVTFRKSMPYFKGYTSLEIIQIQRGRVIFKLDKNTLDFSMMV